MLRDPHPHPHPHGEFLTGLSVLDYDCSDVRVNKLQPVCASLNFSAHNPLKNVSFGVFACVYESVRDQER